MKNKIKEYFYYSKLERNGIFVLSFLCIAFFLFPKIYKPTVKKDPIDFSQYKKEITSFEKALEEKQVPKNKTEIKDLFSFNPNNVTGEELIKLGLSPKVIKTFLNYRSKGGKFFKKEDFKKVYGISDKEYARLKDFIQIEKNKKTGNEKQKDINVPEPSVLIEYFEFDPNSASKEDLTKLGLSKRVANNLLKFREKGGVIYRKEELSKIYGVSEELFEKLLPYISIKEKKQAESFAQVNQDKNSKPKIDLQLDVNAASNEEWQKLYGIGPYYAKRIIESREELGGFYTIDQVGETYNLPDSTFQKIRHQLTLVTPHKLLNLNTISTDKLAKHPYIKYKQAKAIINFRNQHGPFKDLKELKKIIALKQEVVNKIKPYLSIE